MLIRQIFLSTFCGLAAGNMEKKLMVFGVAFGEPPVSEEEKAVSFLWVPPYDGAVRGFSQHMLIRLSERRASRVQRK